jgi:hypothetical protein
MQPEEKAAIKAAGATALIAGTFAATMATPVAWAAVMLGAYRMGKAAYSRTKQERIQQDYFQDN